MRTTSSRATRSPTSGCRTRPAESLRLARSRPASRSCSRASGAGGVRRSRRVQKLVELQDELQREFGRLAAVTVDEPYVNGAFRAASAAHSFLSDVDRRVAADLDLLELTDETHRPFLPFTFLLDSLLVIHRIWCGFWYWGNPTQGWSSRCVRSSRPSSRVTTPRGSGRQGLGGTGCRDRCPGGLDPRELRGHELWRGVHEGPIPAVGDELGRSTVDGRPWIVRRLEEAGGRTAVHVSKEGPTGDPRLVGHHLTAGPRVP